MKNLEKIFSPKFHPIFQKQYDVIPIRYYQYSIDMTFKFSFSRFQLAASHNFKFNFLLNHKIHICLALFGGHYIFFKK